MNAAITPTNIAGTPLAMQRPKFFEAISIKAVIPTINTAVTPLKVVVTLLFFMSTVNGHEHHDEDIPTDPNAPREPIDWILWTHVTLMSLAFGFLFPCGMVLGLTRSKWHVPVQIAGVALATVAWFLGHAHGGRMFHYSAHAAFSWVVVFVVGAQTVAGLYLKLHWTWGPYQILRKAFVPVHGIIGKVLPVIGYVQMVLGGIAMLEFCGSDGDHVGQCLAHFIMGSAFIAYGIVYVISMRLLSPWFQKTGRSQEMYDSVVITAWGVVNTFTEHRIGSPWSHKDFQHTALGVVWACGGLVGIFLSRKGKRSVFPAVIIFLTGFAMSSHAQNSELSTKVHSIFGWTLMLGGIARIIEISIVLRDEAGGANGIQSWQHLPPYLLMAGGFMFMGANEEQLALLNSAMVDPMSYALILFSLAFLVYLYAHILITLYEHTGKNLDEVSRVKLNGNGNASNEALATRADGVQDFELGALLNEEDDEEEEETPVMKTEGRRF